MFALQKKKPQNYKFYKMFVYIYIVLKILHTKNVNDLN